MDRLDGFTHYTTSHVSLSLSIYLSIYLSITRGGEALDLGFNFKFTPLCDSTLWQVRKRVISCSVHP